MNSLRRKLNCLALLCCSSAIVVACTTRPNQKQQATDVDTAKGKVFSTSDTPVYAEPNGRALSKADVSSPAYVLDVEEVKGDTWLRVLLADGRIAWCEGSPTVLLDARVHLRHDSVDATSLPRDREGQAGFSWLTLAQGNPPKDYRITRFSSHNYRVSPTYIRERGRQMQLASSKSDDKAMATTLLPDIQVADALASGWVTFQDVVLRFQADVTFFAGLVNPPFVDSAKEIYQLKRSEKFDYVNLAGIEQQSVIELTDSHMLQQMIVPRNDGNISSISFWAAIGEDNYVFKVQRKNGDTLGFGFHDADKGIATPYILAYDQRDHNKDGVLDHIIHYVMISGDDERRETFVVNGAASSVSDLVF